MGKDERRLEDFKRAGCACHTLRLDVEFKVFDHNQAFVHMRTVEEHLSVYDTYINLAFIRVNIAVDRPRDGLLIAAISRETF